MIPRGRMLAHYRILRLQGRGGMGVVFLAEDTRLGRTVALKILPEEYVADETRLARFEREARSAAALNHPNICTIHEVGQAQGFTYLVMEYVEGRSLRERILEKPLAVAEVLDIAIQIADALEEARKKNIVHRDIKSNNILITPRGQVKVLDFGLAKHVRGEDKSGGEAPDVTASLPSADATFAGTVLGTAGYMAPEQALGYVADHRSDLFSLGVVLYEMLTRRLPFEAETSQMRLGKTLYEEPEDIASFNKSVPEELVRVVKRLLAKKREDRYQEASQVWDELSRIREKLKSPTATRPVTVKAIPMSGAARRRPGLLIAAGAVTIFIAAALFLLTPWKKGRPAADGGGASPTSLVVLPSRVLGTEEYAYLTDAIPSTLSAYLGQTEGLDIKTPLSSFELDKLGGDTSKVADIYRVKYFVHTTLTADGDHFTFVVMLTETKTRSQHWSRQYECASKTYLERTKQIAEDLRDYLAPASGTGTVLTAKTANSKAELAVREAEYFLVRYHYLRAPPDFDRAFSLFQKALELDPRLAEAAAGIASLYKSKSAVIGITPEILAEMEKWTNRALKINPDCAAAWMMKCNLEEARPNSSALTSLGFILKAANLDTRNPGIHATLGNVVPSATLASAAYSEAHRLSPMFYGVLGSLAWNHMLIGRNEEALRLLDELLQIEPGMVNGLYFKFQVLMNMNRLAEAAQLMRELERAAAEEKLSISSIQFVRQTYSAMTTEGKELDRTLTDVLTALDDPLTQPADRYCYTEFLGPLLVRRGKLEAGLEILEKGDVAYESFFLNPDLKRLERTPQCQRVMASAKKSFDATMNVIEFVRARGEFPKYLESPLTELKSQLGI